MRAFISYSHLDAEFLTQLHEHLSTMRRQGILDTWTDRAIPAGGVIDDHVHDQMDQAELYLLLVSSAFIASDYCIEKEFARALERQRAGKARIVPIIIRDCDWKIPELRKFKALPEDGKAVESRHWHSTDEAFANVVSELRKLLEDAGGSGPQPRERVTPEESLLPEARRILDLISAHPDAEQRGLELILIDGPRGPLVSYFIPNSANVGSPVAMKKALFRPAIQQLVRLGHLLPPETDAANTTAVYELNTTTRTTVP